jgi:hypothetical protein
MGNAAMNKFKALMLVTAFGMLISTGVDLFASNEPKWQGNVIARGSERAKIESTPILERPYRPLHFYGNTVRRRHYRGTALPSAKDLTGASSALLFDR